MSLYQLAKNWQTLYDQIDDIPEDAFLDTLEAISGEFQDKADNIACFIKSLEAEADSIVTEIKSLKQREESKRKKAAQLRTYLRDQMKAVGRQKIETPRSCVSIATNPNKVVVDEQFISWAQEYADSLLIFSPPTPDKKAIQQALKEGEKIPFVRLESAQSLRIR